jgi:CoA:oxalate CoA-transferase
MTQPGPLAGILVVDLTRILAGPYCTFLMAELGARVIKIEAPAVGDDARHYGPFVKERSAYFMSINRGKESIALDLKKESDRAILDRLLAKADVIVENFRGGTMERLGYGWETLNPKYPRLIYVAASGFGHTGPDAQRPSYDMVVQGMGGIMSITGEPGRPPVRIGMSIGDIGAGLYAAIGVNAALYHRAATGEATKVDIGMLDCQLALVENAILRYFLTGKAPGPLGARHPIIAPFEAYHAADGYLIIAAGNDSLFVKLCAALGLAAMAEDERFCTNDLRREHVDAIKTEFERVLKTKPVAHWLKVFDDAGVPAGPINDVGQAIESPQAKARNMIVTADDPVAGPIKLVGNPIKFSAFADPPTREPAPALDADRAKILKELGLD